MVVGYWIVRFVALCIDSHRLLKGEQSTSELEVIKNLNDLLFTIGTSLLICNCIDCFFLCGIVHISRSREVEYFMWMNVEVSNIHSQTSSNLYRLIELVYR